jgi:hypothetical protein
VLSVLAALAVWGISELVFGVDVRQPAFGPGVPQDLTAGPIVIATLVLAASLGAPLSGRGIDGESRLVLTLLHLTVGALLIVLLPRTSQPA